MSGEATPEEVLYESRNERQHLLLERDATGVLSLTIDGYWQFSSADEAIFHEMLVDLPALLAPSLSRVLILGGGDALALRNVLRYEEVQKVDLVEFDPEVLEMVRTVPAMRELSEAALEDPRVRMHVRDAWAFIHGEPDAAYDLVICDFPAFTDPALARLFSLEFHQALAKWLAPEGLVSVQVSQDPPDFWAFVESAVKPVYGHLWPSLAPLGDPEDPECDWADFVIGSREPLEPRRALATAHAQLLRPEAIGAQRIANRALTHFETEAYGRAPDFSEPW